MENELKNEDENELPDVTVEFAAIIEKLLVRIVALEGLAASQHRSIELLGEAFLGHQKILEAVAATLPVRPMPPVVN